ncbi:signal recognition particle 14 kDa protein, putative [Eimeria necatrix]|uniref:Signal recognition particle 14 kDa protein n=1 Tax=Eimeria necatrix TaxID=51315 RepID=U6N6T3_9EIME|nr:signal recognition particle 14 kDa protein, putative [Eimeria necatrix]CDJ70405.1 signal recognition particle 14 kDa protein, putative [Eimeria necatrix]
MGLLGEAEFLEALRRLYEESRSKNSGTVWITFKRTFPEVGGSRGAKRRRKLLTCEEKPEATPVCLVRATDGKKKISVQVEGNRALAFSQRLWGMSRIHMDQVRPAPPNMEKSRQQQQHSQGQQQSSQQEQRQDEQHQQQSLREQRNNKKYKQSNASFKREA